MINCHRAYVRRRETTLFCAVDRKTQIAETDENRSIAWAALLKKKAHFAVGSAMAVAVNDANHPPTKPNATATATTPNHT